MDDNIPPTAIDIQSYQQAIASTMSDVDSALAIIDDAQVKHDYTRFKLDVGHITRPYRPLSLLPNVTWANTLFGPVGLGFDSVSHKTFPMGAITKAFETESDRSEWLKLNRPLILTILTIPRECMGPTGWAIINPDNTDVKYGIRYFPERGKLPWWNYHLQYIVGNCKNYWLRGFLYRLLTVK